MKREELRERHVADTVASACIVTERAVGLELAAPLTSAPPQVSGGFARPSEPAWASGLAIAESASLDGTAQLAGTGGREKEVARTGHPGPGLSAWVTA